MLNVVNFGGGSYVLYAEVQGDQIEVDPEPYGDNFARPARLLPLEAKALVAAIDLLGDHLPEGSLPPRARRSSTRSARTRPREGLQITTAKGDDSEVARVVSAARSSSTAARDRVLQGERGRVHRAPRSSRTSLMNGQEGWYVHSWDLGQGRRRARSGSTASSEATDHRRDLRAAPGHRARRARLAAHRRGATPRARARVWISPERARWAREDRRVVRRADATAP